MQDATAQITNSKVMDRKALSKENDIMFKI